MKDLKALEMAVESINPRFHLSENLLKEVKGWKTGNEYVVQLTIKQIGKHEELDDPVEGRFEILKAKAVEEESEGDTEEVSYVSKTI